jgi:hypothetical protein
MKTVALLDADVVNLKGLFRPEALVLRRHGQARQARTAADPAEY